MEMEQCGTAFRAEFLNAYVLTTSDTWLNLWLQDNNSNVCFSIFNRIFSIKSQSYFGKLWKWCLCLHNTRFVSRSPLLVRGSPRLPFSSLRHILRTSQGGWRGEGQWKRMNRWKIIINFSFINFLFSSRNYMALSGVGGCLRDGDGW